MHEASPGYETTSWIDGREQAAQKGFNCCERAAAIAASLSLALLRIVPRPRVAPCDQSWDCVLRSAETVVPGVAKDSQHAENMKRFLFTSRAETWKLLPPATLS